MAPLPGRRVRRLSLSFLLWAGLFLAPAVVHAEPMPKEVVRESAQEYDIAREVVAFYQELVRKNPAIAAERTRLVEALKRAEPAQRLELRDDARATLWITSQAYSTTRGGRRARDATHIYLVRQPLWSALTGSYSEANTLVARVKVKWHADYHPDARDANGHLLKSNRLELVFDGFFEAKVESGPVERAN